MVVRALIGLARSLLTDRPTALAACLLAGEAVLCSLLVLRGRYTKIDWTAYMQEVEGPLVHGEWDYSKLRGETGPLVYPAGFVYLYAALRALGGGDGTELRPVQWAFAAVYVGTQALVFALYVLATPRARVPPWVLPLLCVSKRLHSLYVLRLFNDCWATLLLYASLLALAAGRRWRLGCVLFSLAVGVKMNVMLFAPGLLLLLLKQGGPRGALTHIALCALVQAALGAPFLCAHPVSYVLGAFGGFGDLNQKWSVNWQFLPREVFHSKALTLALLVAHLTLLVVFTLTHWTAAERSVHRAAAGPPAPLRVSWSARGSDDRGNGDGGGDRGSSDGRADHAAGESGRPRDGGGGGGGGGGDGGDGDGDGDGDGESHLARELAPEHIAYVMLTCNFVAVCCMRSLHFQFYTWYYHAMPLLLWYASALPLPAKLGVLGALEFTWSYHLDPIEGTATPLSSAVLQIAHLVALSGLLRSPPPRTFEYSVRRGQRPAGATDRHADQESAPSEQHLQALARLNNADATGAVSQDVRAHSASVPRALPRPLLPLIAQHLGHVSPDAAASAALVRIRGRSLTLQLWDGERVEVACDAHCAGGEVPADADGMLAALGAAAETASRKRA